MGVPFAMELRGGGELSGRVQVVGKRAGESVCVSVVPLAAQS